MKERQGSNYAKFFSQTTHTYNKEAIPMGLLLGGGGIMHGHISTGGES
jgi:hypothetical protein